MNIIFVCTGNTCRSPMAEYYLKSKKICGVNVSSRGFGGGECANEKSIAVMKEIDIDISNHISRPITAEEAKNADAIICMTESHKQLLLTLGCDQNKICVLSGGIADPFGCDIDTYRKCRDSISAGIDRLIQSGFFGDCNADIKIGAATCNDIPDIANIENQSFSVPWSRNAINDSMNAGTCFYTARVGSKTVGYMGLSKIAGEGYVTNIAVLPDYRRKGVGKALLQYVINECENQLEFISLEVRVSNDNAISLYKSFGFTEVGRRKRFYTNPEEDALIMTKTFI